MITAVAVGFLGAAAISALAWRWFHDPERWWARGDWERLCSLRGDDPVAIHWRSVGLLGRGLPLEAVAEIRKLETKRCAPVLFVNSLVEALVTAGRYQEAVATAGRFDLHGPGWLPHERVLVLINCAEALYNLGRWDEALAVLAPLDPDVRGDALARSALALQRSWIFMGLGRPRDAAAAVEQIELADLPRSYWPECHFARASLAIGVGDFARASTELDLAERTARRVSTKRNLLFMRGRLELARGELVSAERFLAAGAEHPFRYQGGDGLRLWGEVLMRLGRPEEARNAWRRVVEQDPEGHDAHLASTALGAAGGDDR